MAQTIATDTCICDRSNCAVEGAEYVFYRQVHFEKLDRENKRLASPSAFHDPKGTGLSVNWKQFVKHADHIWVLVGVHASSNINLEYKNYESVRVFAVDLDALRSYEFFQGVKYTPRLRGSPFPKGRPTMVSHCDVYDFRFDDIGVDEGIRLQFAHKAVQVDMENKKGIEEMIAERRATREAFI